MSEDRIVWARGTSTIEQNRDVYFVLSRTVGLVKIGVANRSNIRYRLRDLAFQCPVPLTLIGIVQCTRCGATEGELHERFADERRHGEWFFLSERLSDFIITDAWMPQRIKALQRELDHVVRDRGRPRKDASRTEAEKPPPKPAP